MSINYIRSLRWVDYIYYAILDPRALARMVSQSGKTLMWVSFVFPVIFAVTLITMMSLFVRQNHFFYYKITYGWILLSIVMIAAVFIISALVDIALQLTLKKGNIGTSISIVNFSFIPLLFLLPIVSIFIISGFAPVFFFFLFFMLFSVWSWIIIISGISELNGISFGRSCAMCLIPVSILSAIFILSMVLVFMLMAGMIQYIFV